jgi:Zn-dependent protease
VGGGRGALSRRDTIVLGVLGAIVLWTLLGRKTVGSQSLIFFAVLIPSVILHEVSHGVMALALGDDTAQRAGRLSLNPVRHVDPVGTIILPAILVLSGAGAFGWAKPVPVNVRRLRSPRNHSVLVSLVGPATNIVLAVLAAVALRISLPAEAGAFGFYARAGVIVRGGPMVGQLLYAFGLVNLFLAVFNLLPIPPLDGSVLIERLLPARYWNGYLQFRRYSMGLLFVIVLLLPGHTLSRIFEPAVRLWGQLL